MILYVRFEKNKMNTDFIFIFISMMIRKLFLKDIRLKKREFQNKFEMKRTEEKK